MSHNCLHGQCAVPPHPDLFARQKSELLKVQGNDNSAAFKHSVHIQALKQASKDHSSHILGLNDGTIFPRSHFDKPVSVTTVSRAALERTPLKGSINVILVLVEFQDVKMGAGAQERFQNLFFSTGKIPTGSVNEYYQEVSRGKISLAGEVLGPYTLSQKMAYYANGKSGRDWPEPNSVTMAEEAVTAATGKTNFNKYDNDGNGMIDVFCVVHAGTGGETSGNTDNIWSVKWTLNQERRLNDVNAFGFLTIPEDAKIGVSAHEIGHLLFGWPDLYDTDGTSEGIGNWCLMSYGSWGGGGDRPVHPSAWCKANQGWIDVVNETQNHQIVLKDVESGGKAHRLWKDGDTTSSEYFLIENRRFSGFDASLPGDGLLVWHIDDSIGGNTNELHPMVGLVQADGLEELKFSFGDAGDPFPGTLNKKAFNATSTPNSKAYSGQDTFVSISNIPSASPSMNLDITVKAIEPPKGGAFDSKTWYRLTNTFAGHALDVINDGAGNKEGLLQMSRLGNFSGQHWQIVPNGDGKYALRTLFLGAKRQLDVYGDDKRKPHLAAAGNFSGQIWIITPWGDGTWHLENTYSGKDLYLDTMEGGPKVALNSANVGRPTQRWTIKPIRSITESGF